MKIRNGFVSNSSSSSFCIAKCYMTNEQITKFRKMLSDNSSEFYETYIVETNLYFQGKIDQSDVIISKFIDKNNLSKFASYYC
jgi:hypothetical protein